MSDAASGGIAVLEVGGESASRPTVSVGVWEVDVESALFGIDSTNLVNPRPAVCNKPVSKPDINFFERNAVFLPDPLVIEDKQRPFPIPK